MKTVMKKVSEIILYKKNTKKHDQKQIDNVAESIRQYGWAQPLVIDKEGNLIIGHCRLLAAKKLGLKEVPCVCMEGLSPEQVNALRIVDNKTNESEWDFDLLLDELEEVDLSMFDFDFELNEEDDFDESDLDDDTEKQNVVVSINCANVADWESIKERVENCADEIGASIAVKMA